MYILVQNAQNIWTLLFFMTTCYLFSLLVPIWLLNRTGGTELLNGNASDILSLKLNMTAVYLTNLQALHIQPYMCVHSKQTPKQKRRLIHSNGLFIQRTSYKQLISNWTNYLIPRIVTWSTNVSMPKMHYMKKISDMKNCGMFHNALHRVHEGLWRYC